MKPPFEVEEVRMLIASTGHLPYAVVERIDAIENPGCERIDFDGFLAEPVEYGYLMLVRGPDRDTIEGLMFLDDEERNDCIESYLPPPDMLAVWQLAQRYGYDYIKFDRDGPEITDLPTWEW